MEEYQIIACRSSNTIFNHPTPIVEIILGNKVLSHTDSSEEIKRIIKNHPELQPKETIIKSELISGKDIYVVDNNVLNESNRKNLIGALNMYLNDGLSIL